MTLFIVIFRINGNCKKNSAEKEESVETCLNGRYIVVFKVPQNILDDTNFLYSVFF